MTGVQTCALPIYVDSEGFIDIEQLKNAIGKKTLLISVMHANNEIGTLQDIKAIGEVASDSKVAFHTDAVQSFTKAPIDVDRKSVV